MPIAVHCPGCNARLNAPDSAAGRNVKCPKCQTLMTIPAKEAAADDFEVVDEPAPKKPAAPPRKPVPVPAPTKRPAVKKDIFVDDEDDDRPRKRRRGDDDDEDDDDRPRKKKGKKATGPPPGLLIGGGIAAVLVLAGVSFAIYWFAIREKPKDTAAAGTTGTTDTGAKGGPPSGWVQFTPTNGGFKAYLPSKPFNEGSPAPRAAMSSKLPRAQEYAGRVMEPKESYVVVAIAYPEGMSLPDKEKYIEDSFKKEMEVPPEFIKETSRTDVTIGGKPGKQIVYEIQVANGLAAKGKNRPGGPDKDVPELATVVMRRLVAENRGYILISVSITGGRATNEKAFFDYFELVPETAGSEPGPGPAPVPGPGPGPGRPKK